jgi:allophanate hydrolase subunit 2
MGGYPVIASVISADIDRLAQLGPAQPVLFERVTLEEARELDRQSRSILTRTLITIAAAANDDID